MKAKTAAQCRQFLRHTVRQSDCQRVAEGIALHADPGVRITRGSVRRWLIRENVPSDGSRKAIERWSKGEIPARAWDA